MFVWLLFFVGSASINTLLRFHFHRMKIRLYRLLLFGCLRLLWEKVSLDGFDQRKVNIAKV